MKKMFVKWSFTSLLTKQTCFTFSGTAKRATRKFVGTISFHYAEINQMCSYYKERYKGNEGRLEFKLCDQWLDFLKETNIWKEINIYHVLFHYFVVKFSCLYKSVLLFTVQRKLVALIFPSFITVLVNLNSRNIYD